MSYSELVISDSPLGYWEMNYWTPLNPNIMSSSSATYATQYGTVSSNVKPIVAGLGQSTSLPLTTSSIVIPNATSVLNAGNEKISTSIEMWFNLLSSSSNTTYILKTQSASNFYSLFQCYLINDKLWLQTASGKDYIQLINLEDQQYVNFSYSNGNVSMTLNVDETVSVPCDSRILYTQDQLIVGPGNGTASFHVNSLAMYKYVLNSDQMTNRMRWAKRDGSPESMAFIDGYSVININYIPSTSFKVDVLRTSISNYTSNIRYDGNSLSLIQLPALTISSSAISSSQDYILSASGIRFNTASNFPHIDLSRYMNYFDFSNSTIRFQFNASATSSGTIFSIGEFDNYRSIVGRVINSPAPAFRLSLIDMYDNEYYSITSASLSAGYHNVAINFYPASVTLFVDGASISGNIKSNTIINYPKSIFIGSNIGIYNSKINFIGNNSFSDSTDGWYADQATSASIAISYDKSFLGNTSMIIRNSASGTLSTYYFNNISSSAATVNMIPVTASKSYYFEAVVLSSSSVPINANIRYYNASLTQLGSVGVGASSTSVSSSWTTASVTSIAPASAVYAVPYITASNVPATASVYVSNVLMKSSNNQTLAYAYNNYVKNFAIDQLTSSVTDYNLRGRFMLKLNGNLNISQTGSAQGMLRDFNQTDAIINATVSYGNPSSNINIEHAKSSASVLTWSNLSNNAPMTNYDFSNITADEIRVTLSTDDSYYDVPSLNYFALIYHTASSLLSSDGLFYISNENYSTSSLSFPVLNDTDTDIFSKSSNLGFKIISNTTGGLKVGSITSSVTKIDFLFKVDSFSKNSPIINDGSNYLYVSSTGSIVSSNPSASLFINGSSVSGGTLLLGEIYHLAAFFASAKPYVWLGYDSASRTPSLMSFGNINVSTSTSSSIYGSNSNYASKMFNNYQKTDTQIFANNFVTEQIASMELYSELSGSWGFTTTNASAVRTTASYVHGGYSILLRPTASSVTSTIQANSSASVLIPVVPGRNYVAMVKMIGNVSRLASCNIIWYSSNNITSSISVSSGNSSSTTANWYNYSVTASAPLNSAYAAVQASIYGVNTTDTYYIDEFGFFAENVTNWTLPNTNKLSIGDGSNQTTTDTAKNYFSPDKYYFEMLSLPKIKIVAKKSTNTNI